MPREDMRQALIKAAVERRTVTYGYLMDKFGISRGSSEGDTVVGALGEIDRGEYQAGAPGFAAIVVRKDTGYPGGGFFCWDGVPVELRRKSGEGQNPQLSEAEKRYIKSEQEKIWNYYRNRYPTHYDLGTFAEDR
jgi:hypothetical protein